MTTIAYKDGVIAYDSRCMSSETIVSDTHNKHAVENGVHFFFSGNICDQKHLVDLYFKRDIDVPLDHVECNAFSAHSGKVYKLGVCKRTGIWRSEVIYPEALGSGTDHALTAMDMGATAKEAVKMAAKRDSGTGGRIRTFKVK